MRLTCCLLFVALAACTQFPALEDVEGPDVADAKYPRLLSVSELNRIPDSVTNLELQDNVLDRVASLRARAARLQRPVIDRTTRARMRRGVR